MNGLKRLNDGEILLTLTDRNNNSESLTLRPTVRAWQVISRQYSGLAKARQMLIDENVDAIAFIIRIGTGMSDRDARKLDDRIWENGVNVDLLIPLIKYIAVLNNGGRRLADDIENVFDSSTDIQDVHDSRSIEDYSEKND